MRALALALVLAFSAAATAQGGVEINILSDFETGTRLYHAGKLEMAITMFRQGAEKGDPKSMFALGTHYYFGEGVEKDLTRARELFTSANDKGHAESAYMLGLMFARGEGVPVDHAKALQYINTAAYACVPQALSEIAQVHYEGRGVPKDELNGIAWLAIAADHDEDKETKKTVKKIKGNLTRDDRARVKQLEADNRSNVKCVEK